MNQPKFLKGLVTGLKVRRGNPMKDKPGGIHIRKPDTKQSPRVMCTADLYRFATKDKPLHITSKLHPLFQQ